ncbi:hypothetical protein BKI52_01565 [marine bacterium AO1-C]|nr:hypothetical protein BKI52_01565 [marine bacterium AO1-C]
MCFTLACTSESVEIDEKVLTVEDLTVTINENFPPGIVIGTIQASSTLDSITYEIITQDFTDALTINEATGELMVLNQALFDFEARQKISAIVKVTAGEQEEDVQVTININDVDETNRVIWKGVVLTFTKQVNADPTQATNQDRITDNVWITRGNEGGQLYNAKLESKANKTFSPFDTEWAIGTLDNIDNLAFKPFREAVTKPKEVVGKDLVLHLINDNIYLGVKFTKWSAFKDGEFSYERTTQ